MENTTVVENSHVGCWYCRQQLTREIPTQTEYRGAYC